MQKVDINYETKVYDLLKNYPELEAYLITLSPRYKKLKNPILRRTIARVAVLRQAAYLGGFQPEEFVNLLRKKAGLEPLEGLTQEEEISAQKPEWANKEPKFEINAKELLDEGKNPLKEINSKIKKLSADEVILLKADFIPSPLIDEMKKKDLDVVTVQSLEQGWYETYVRKVS